MSVVCCLWFFFFSSRRRHTRCLSDWSSDVCSSDLCGHQPGNRGSPAGSAGQRPIDLPRLVRRYPPPPRDRGREEVMSSYKIILEVSRLLQDTLWNGFDGDSALTQYVPNAEAKIGRA